MEEDETDEFVPYETSEVLAVKTLVSSLLKSLDCPICLDLLDDPVCTTCHHVFCRKCIQTVLHSKFKAPCPLCITPITKRCLREKPKFREILQTVKEVAQAVRDDCGLDVSPPKRLLVDATSPEGRSSMLAFQLAHPSPQKPQKPQNTYGQQTLDPVSKMQEKNMRTDVLLEEDAENLVHTVKKNCSNTNIFSGFPTKNLKKYPGTKKSLNSIEHYFPQARGTKKTVTCNQVLADRTVTGETSRHVELFPIKSLEHPCYKTELCVSNSSSSTRTSSTGVVSNLKKANNIENESHSDNAEKHVKPIPELIADARNPLGVIENRVRSMKSVDEEGICSDLERKLTAVGNTNVDALDLLANGKPQPSSEFADETEQKLVTSIRRIFKSKNNENSEPPKSVATCSVGENFDFDPYHFIASQRTPKRSKKRGRKRKIKDTKPVKQNCLTTFLKSEKKSEQLLPEQPLKEVKENRSDEKGCLLPDSLDDFMDIHTSKVKRLSKTAVKLNENDDSVDDVFFFMTPAENMREYRNESEKSTKVKSNGKVKRTPHSSSVKRKKKKIESTEQNNGSIVDIVSEIAKSEAHELTIVCESNNASLSKSSSKNKSALTAAKKDPHTAKLEMVTKQKKILEEHVNYSDSSDTEPLPYLNRDNFLYSFEKESASCSKNQTKQDKMTNYNDILTSNLKPELETNSGEKKTTYKSDKELLIKSKESLPDADRQTPTIKCSDESDEDLEQTQPLELLIKGKEFLYGAVNLKDRRTPTSKNCDEDLDQTQPLVTANYDMLLPSEENLPPLLNSGCESAKVCSENAKEDVKHSKSCPSPVMPILELEQQKEKEGERNGTDLEGTESNSKSSIKIENNCNTKEKDCSGSSKQLESSQCKEILLSGKTNRRGKDVSQSLAVDQTCPEVGDIHKKSQEKYSFEGELNCKENTLPEVVAVSEDEIEMHGVSLDDKQVEKQNISNDILLKDGQSDENPEYAETKIEELQDEEASEYPNNLHLSNSPGHNNIHETSFTSSPSQKNIKSIVTESNMNVSVEQEPSQFKGSNCSAEKSVNANVEKAVTFCASQNVNPDISVSISLSKQSSSEHGVFHLKLSLNNACINPETRVSGSFGDVGCPNCHTNLNISFKDVHLVLSSTDVQSLKEGELHFKFPKTEQHHNSGTEQRIEQDTITGSDNNLKGTTTSFPDQKITVSAPTSEINNTETLASELVQKTETSNLQASNFPVKTEDVSTPSSIETNEAKFELVPNCENRDIVLTHESEWDSFPSNLSMISECHKVNSLENKMQTHSADSVCENKVSTSGNNSSTEKISKSSLLKSDLKDSSNRPANEDNVQDETCVPEDKTNVCEATEINGDHCQAIEAEEEMYNCSTKLRKDIFVGADSLVDSPSKNSTSSSEGNLWSSREADRYSYCDDVYNANNYDEDIFASVSSSSFDMNENDLKRERDSQSGLSTPEKIELEKPLNRSPYSSPNFEAFEEDNRFYKFSEGFSDIGEDEIELNFQKIAEKQKLMMGKDSQTVLASKSDTSDPTVKPVGLSKRPFPKSSSGSGSVTVVRQKLNVSQNKAKQKTFRRIRTFSDSSSEPETFTPLVDTVHNVKNPIKDYIELSSQSDEEMRPSQAMKRVLENIHADLHCLDNCSEKEGGSRNENELVPCSLPADNHSEKIEEEVHGCIEHIPSSPLCTVKEMCTVRDESELVPSSPLPDYYTEMDFQSAFSTEPGDLSSQAKDKLIAEIENIKMQLDHWKEKQRSNAKPDSSLMDVTEAESEDAIPPTPPHQLFRHNSKASTPSFR